MEESIHSFRPPDASRGGGQPIVLVAQLMRQMVNMQHVDDVFLWLARAMVQHLDIAVVQFLAIRRDGSGQFHAEVRATASQNPSLAQVSYVSRHVTALAERVFQEQQGIPSCPVESVFPALQASLLVQRSLRCWAGYFLRNDAFLPPARHESASGKMPMPLTMVVSLFTLYPLSTEQAKAVHFTLEQTMRIIIDRGFLPLHVASESMTTRNNRRNNVLTYAHLIPQRAESIEQFQVANPFTSVSIIEDKNARRLYAAIDGDKDIAELTQMLGLGKKEMLDALHYLFEQRRIHFYTLTGELIQNPEFLS